MLAYIEILRPLNCFMGAIAVWIGSLVAGAPLYPGEPVLFAMASAFLICGGGMAINDYFDTEIDRINRPKRPIPSGRMKKDSAFVYSIFLLLAGITLSYFINTNAFYTAITVSAILLSLMWSSAKPLLCYSQRRE